MCYDLVYTNQTYFSICQELGSYIWSRYFDANYNLLFLLTQIFVSHESFLRFQEYHQNILPLICFAIGLVSKDFYVIPIWKV